MARINDCHVEFLLCLTPFVTILAIYGVGISHRLAQKLIDDGKHLDTNNYTVVLHNPSTKPFTPTTRHEDCRVIISGQSHISGGYIELLERQNDWERFLQPRGFFNSTTVAASCTTTYFLGSIAS